MRRGFTILELCFVITIIAMLTAVTVPAFDIMVRRAHMAEAHSMLSAIAHAQLQHQRDHGSYLACGPTGDIPSPTAAFPNKEACWQALNIQVAGDVRYRYTVTLTDQDFTATAEGDLDRDGTLSRFTLQGSSFRVESTDELE